MDIGKNVNCFGAYSGYELKPVVEPQEIRTNRSGWQVVTSTIDALLNCGAYDWGCRILTRDFPVTDNFHKHVKL